MIWDSTRSTGDGAVRNVQSFNLCSARSTRFTSFNVQRFNRSTKEPNFHVSGILEMSNGGDGQFLP